MKNSKEITFQWRSVENKCIFDSPLHKQDNVLPRRRSFMDIDLRSRRGTTHVFIPHIFMCTCYTVGVSERYYIMDGKFA